MDPKLHFRLLKIRERIDSLEPLEEKHLTMKASKDAMLAQLSLKAPGKSVAEREMKALASPEWQTYCQGMAKAETDYNRARRELDLQFKAYDAEHLTYKIENSSIQRGVD